MALDIPGEVGAPIVNSAFLQINLQNTSRSADVQSLNSEDRSSMYRTKSDSVIEGKKFSKSILSKKVLDA
jgi:hypothetical protein